MQENLPLKDIHLPTAISWWPPAIGWWLLVILVCASVIGCYYLYKRLTRPSAVKQAKLVLSDIKQSSSTDTIQMVKALSACLRRLAMSVDGRDKTASLLGEEWLAYLDRSMDDTPFTKGVGRLIVDAPYQQQTIDGKAVNQLVELCEIWVSRQTA